MEKYIDLVLTRHWYDEIRAGRKDVEYRAVTPFWARRLGFDYTTRNGKIEVSPRCKVFTKSAPVKFYAWFRRGYVSAPALVLRIVGIDIGPCPITGWNGLYFRIRLDREEVNKCKRIPVTKYKILKGGDIEWASDAK